MSRSIVRLFTYRNILRHVLFFAGWVLVVCFQWKGVKYGVLGAGEAALCETAYILFGSVWIAVTNYRETL